jgi:HEAT repeat protein
MNRRWMIAWLAMVLCGVTEVAAAQETFLGRSLDAWSDAITSADQQKRSQAAWAIAQLAGNAQRGQGDQVYFAELVKLTSDGDATVRYWGVVGLGAYGQRGGVKDGGQTAVVNTLIPLLDDKSSAPRIAAAEVLGLFGRLDKALPILEAAMNDPQESVRIQAVAALEKLGGAARSSLPTLRKAASDSSQYVKRISERAVAKLEADKK